MKPLLRGVISLVLIGGIFWKLGGIGEVGGLIAKAGPAYLMLLIVGTTLDRLFTTFKWTRLLNGRGVHLPLLLGMKIYCASMFWGVVLPTTIGADAIRAFSTSRKGLDANEVIASIMIERMVGFLSALLLGLLSLVLLSLLRVLDPRLTSLWWTAVAMIISGTIVLAASFSQTAFDLVHDRLLGRYQNNQLMRRLRQFHSIYQGYRDNEGNLIVFFVLTFIEQWFPILFNWLIARSMGIDIGFLWMAGAIPLSMLVSRIPIGIGGLGVFDGIFILMMSLAGVSAAEAIAIAFLGRIVEITSWLPWWLAHVFPGRGFRPPRPVMEKP